MGERLREQLERIRQIIERARETGPPMWPLSELVDDPARTTHLRPLTVRCADGPEEEAETWRDVAVAATVHSRLLDTVPVPLRAGPRAQRFFINHEPLHADGRKMKGPRPLRWNGRVYYAEMHYSAYSLMVTLSWSLRQAGLDPNAIEVHVGSGEQSQETST